MYIESNTYNDDNVNFDNEPVNYKSRPSYNSNVNNPSDLNYMHILMKKKKKEILNQKIREERELKELENCTFKPKINNYANKDNVVPFEMNGIQAELRIEKLHRIGTETLINKKDKTRDDMELEKNRKEYTFKPSINDRFVINFLIT